MIKTVMRLEEEDGRIEGHLSDSLMSKLDLQDYRRFEGDCLEAGIW
jgi:hypothetical protein